MIAEAIIDNNYTYAKTVLKKLHEQFPNWTEALHKEALLLKAQGETAKEL